MYPGSWRIFPADWRSRGHDLPSTWLPFAITSWAKKLLCNNMIVTAKTEGEEGKENAQEWSFQRAVAAPPNTPLNPSSWLHPRTQEVTNAITLRSIWMVAYLTLVPLWSETSISCMCTCTVSNRILRRGKLSPNMHLNPRAELNANQGVYGTPREFIQPRASSSAPYTSMSWTQLAQSTR